MPYTGHKKQKNCRKIEIKHEKTVWIGSRQNEDDEWCTNMVSTLKNKKGTFISKEFHIAHELSFLMHDMMAELLVSGEKGNFFVPDIYFEENEYLECIKESDDLGKWLKNTKKLEDRAKVLKAIVMPAILSDMLHCIYETLETSRKGKLNISYMLIRKPLQESLYLLEEIILNELDFSENFIKEVSRLESKNAGGIKGHQDRIEKILKIIDSKFGLSSEYIAQLRYDKSNKDSFDGVCNLAMHLFTNHTAIKTENMNINFIFSQYEQKITQWKYLYSRLPYLLFYTMQIIDHITNTIVSTTQEYLDDMQRRVSALIILWWDEIDEQYKNKALENFVKATSMWLNQHCLNNGYSRPTKKSLTRMYKTGAYPNEKKEKVKERNDRYTRISEENNRLNNF